MPSPFAFCSSGQYEEEAGFFMVALQQIVEWIAQHPLAGATMLYAIGVFGVLAYSYFEPRDQT